MSEANTFSIVACCPRTGELGVAVATAVPAVGSMCPYICSGVAAASTQSWVNPYLALSALAKVEEGHGAERALTMALADDDARELRQIGLVDAASGSAAHTGAQCTPWCGHILVPGVAIQGNMLTGPAVLDAMATAYAASRDADLAERLMLALEAGDAAGGDKRGRQSAALRVHAGEAYPLIDIRADEHAAPVTELRRILLIARAQLVPFVRGMPRRGAPAGPVPAEVSEMLLRPPPDRPRGGGSRPGS
jgi:uncharacterized Ntn-hydrolase superfamily protein